MIVDEPGQSEDVTSHHIRYDWDNPSPVFSAEQVQYVDAIKTFMSPEDTAKLRKVETMVYNAFINKCGYNFLPGLRGDRDIDGDPQDGLYIRRFSSIEFSKMMDLFLRYKPEYFPRSGSGGNMPLYRMTIPNGDRYYPVEFFGDISAWRRRLQESAELHQTSLGKFDRGTFVVSDGQRIPFGDLKIDFITARRIPKSW